MSCQRNGFQVLVTGRASLLVCQLLQHCAYESNLMDTFSSMPSATVVVQWPWLRCLGLQEYVFDVKAVGCTLESTLLRTPPILVFSHVGKWLRVRVLIVACLSLFRYACLWLPPAFTGTVFD